MTTRTHLRQKDTELEELRQANRDLTHDAEDLRRTQAETEDSCNEIIQKTNETAEVGILAYFVRWYFSF